MTMKFENFISFILFNFVPHFILFMIFSVLFVTQDDFLRRCTTGADQRPSREALDAAAAANGGIPDELVL